LQIFAEFSEVPTAKVARDNMGHSECPTTLEIYSKTWWDERAAAVSAVVDLVMKSDELNYGAKQNAENSPQMLFLTNSENWRPN
jgi:hypothetical protein